MMNVYEQTIQKIRNLPEPLVKQVSDFIDFIAVKNDLKTWEIEQNFPESLELAESDFCDYKTNLEDYEERLARGEIKW